MKVFEYVGIVAAAFIIVISIATLVGEVTPYDSTDPVDGRSGMRLYTDAGTGCQYVGAPSVGLTPRMAADGRQVCAPVGASAL